MFSELKLFLKTTLGSYFCISPAWPSVRPFESSSINMQFGCSCFCAKQTQQGKEGFCLLPLRWEQEGAYTAGEGSRWALQQRAAPEGCGSQGSGEGRGFSSTPPAARAGFSAGSAGCRGTEWARVRPRGASPLRVPSVAPTSLFLEPDGPRVRARVGVGADPHSCVSSAVLTNVLGVGR